MATTPSTASAHDASEQTSRTPSGSRKLTLRLASSTDDFKSRLVLTPRTNRVAALATPARNEIAAARGYGSHAALTPRQAAITARRDAEELKKREGMLLRQQREEMKNAAKAKHAAVLIHQQEMLRKRAETSQRQRKAAATAKKAARERETAAMAKELQAKMRESREVQEYLSREAREKRRNSIAYQNDAWARERELKKKLHEARQQEEKMVMDGRNVFLEAKQRVREQRELTEKQDRVWRARARAKKSEKTSRLRQGALAAHEAHRYRRDRALDQAALEKEAAEEKRFRRGSTQWRRNEKMLELEIKRGSAAEALDAKRLADEVYLREEDRKAREREFVNARKAEEEYRCLQHMSRRLYRQEEEMQRKGQEARERRVMLEDRASVLESKRNEEEAELDRREALRELPSEKTKLEILEAIWSRQAHPAAAAAARGRRRLRLEKVEELVSSGLIVSPEAHTSGESGGAGRVSRETNGGFGRSGCSGFHRDRDGAMSDSLSSCGSSRGSSGSGMGIAGRLSVCSSLDSLVLECRERRSRGINDAVMSMTSQSATGLGGSSFSSVDVGSSSSKKKNLRVVTDLDLDEKDAIYGTAGVSSAPSWSDASVFEARGVTAEAAAVLAAAEQSFDSVESLDEAEAAAMASAAVANWSPSSGPSHYYKESGFFPLRAFAFPETSTEEARRKEAQAEKEAEQRVRGSAMNGSEASCGVGDVGVIPSGKYGRTFTAKASERDGSSVPGAKTVSSTMPITVDVLGSMDGNDDPSFLAAPSPAGSDVGDCEGGDGFEGDRLLY